MSKKLRHNHAFKAALLMSTGLVLIACSSNPEPHSNVSYNSEGELVTANAPVEKSQKQNMEWVRLMRVADRAWKLNDHDTALRLYRNANTARPADLRPLMGMAEILRKTNRGRMAINIYNAALEAHPDNADIHSGIGYSLLSLDKPFMATESFKSAIDLEADNARALGGMAVALDTAGEHMRAHDYYRQAIRQDPENLTYQSNLGLSLALSGHTDEAIALLERVAASPRATAKHRQNLALVYGLAGKSQEAMRYSRMDLSENDSRNNQLYFRALNGTGTQEAPTRLAKTEPAEQPVIAEMRAPVIRKTHAATQNTLTIGSGGPASLAVAHETKSLNANPSMTRSTAPRQLSPTAPDLLESTPELSAANEQALADNSLAIKVEMPKSEAPTRPENQIIASQAVRKEFISAEFIAENITISQPPTSFVAATQAPALKQAETQAPMVHKAAIAQTPMVQPQEKTAAPEKAYFVQLGSYRSASRALMGWQTLKAKHQSLLMDYNPLIASADLGEEQGGLYFRLRVGGFAKHGTPMSLCSDLKTQKADCFTPYVVGFDGPILDQETIAAPQSQPALPLIEANAENSTDANDFLAKYDNLSTSF